jgi:hypothetical protein
MSYISSWSNGGWLTICDACGRKFKESELRQRWDGLMVCKGDWEVRQPQDYVRGVADIQAPPYVRPEQANVFLPYNFTKYPVDEIDITDKVKFSVTKYIRNEIPATTSALNGAALNEYVLNYSDTTPGGATETLSITEAFEAILGRNLSDTTTVTETIAKVITTQFSDTISIGESLQLVEVEQYADSLSLSESVTRNISKSLSDTLSISESVTTTLVSPLALNGAALNTYGLD